jgi:ribosomal protein S18 acetylase RimI-like enzyme
MSLAVHFVRDRATSAEVQALLTACDHDYVPSLSSRVSLEEYASKIVTKAVRFEAWMGQRLVGLVAAYCNESTKTAFITNVSVEPRFRGGGLGGRLMASCVSDCGGRGMQQITLFVNHTNPAAVALYQRHGFQVATREGDDIVMVHNISEMQQRASSGGAAES